MTKEEQVLFVMKRKQMKKINKACQILLDTKDQFWYEEILKNPLLDVLLCAGRTKKLTNPLERLAEAIIKIDKMRGRDDL
jgi:hypothetical protein